VGDLEPALVPCLKPLLEWTSVTKLVSEVTYNLVPEVRSSSITDDGGSGSSASSAQNSSSSSSSPSSPSSASASSSSSSSEQPLRLTAENRLAVFRASVRYALVERRREAFTAMAEGFRGKSGGDVSGPVAGMLLHQLSIEERQTFVSGDERIDAEAFVRLLRYDELEQQAHRGGGSSAAASASSSSSSSSSCSSSSLFSSSSTASYAQSNFDALKRVVRSAPFAPFLPKLLRFICSCDVILPDTSITVIFDPLLEVDACPEARTCVSSLVLSARGSYGSDDDLFRKLRTCAENSTGFGFK
jgi:hypothetical protein